MSRTDCATRDGSHGEAWVVAIQGSDEEDSLRGYSREEGEDGAFSLTSIEPGDDETTDDGSVILCAQDLSPFSHTPRGEYKQ